MTQRRKARVRSRTGSRLEDLLIDEGLQDEVEAQALKRVLAWQLKTAMKARGLTKQALAARMHTSRSQLDRLLDPENDAVQLDTIARAARALGRRVELRLVEGETRGRNR